MPKRLVEFFIVDILVAIDVIKRHVSNIDSASKLIWDESVFTVVTRQCEIIGEAMKYIIDDERLKGIVNQEWKEIVAFRNIIAHEYFGLNEDEIFNIVKEEVPELEKEIIAFISKFPDKKLISQALSDVRNDLLKINRRESVDYLEKIEALIR